MKQAKAMIWSYVVSDWMAEDEDLAGHETSGSRIIFGVY